MSVRPLIVSLVLLAPSVAYAQVTPEGYYGWGQHQSNIKLKRSKERSNETIYDVERQPTKMWTVGKPPTVRKVSGKLVKLSATRIWITNGKKETILDRGDLLPTDQKIVAALETKINKK